MPELCANTALIVQRPGPNQLDAPLPEVKHAGSGLILTVRISSVLKNDVIVAGNLYNMLN